MDSFWMCILLGLVCGVFSAVFGVGSGIIMVPALVLIGGLGQKSAQGVALAIMVPMALTGAIRYKMNPQIQMDMRLIGLLAAGGVVGAIAGAWIVARLDSGLLRKLFAVILVVTAVRMFFTGEKARREPPRPDNTPSADARSLPPEAPPHVDTRQ